MVVRHLNQRQLQLRFAALAVLVKWWVSQEIKARGLVNHNCPTSPQNASTSASPAWIQGQLQRDSFMDRETARQILAKAKSAKAPFKKKKPARTTERFKFVNAAVAQATILGDDKLILVTMCELADDDGCMHHGEDALAKITKKSQPTVHRCIQRLIKAGAIQIVTKGSWKWKVTEYRIILKAFADGPTIYNVLKEHSKQKQASKPGPKAGWTKKTKNYDLNTYSLGIRDLDTYSNRIPNYALPILCELPDIDFDFDSSSFLFKIGDSIGGFAAVPVNLEGKQKNQNQSQNQPEVLGSRCATSEATNSKPKTTAEKRETKTNTKLNRDCPLCGDWSPEGYVHTCAKEALHA
jgi:hypothetical protein